VLYQCTTPAPVANLLQHSVRLVNTGSSPVDLFTIKLRYWYTNEPYKQQVANIYWATIGRQNVTARFVAMENITPEADYYLELGFTKEAGSLSPGGTVEIQLGINTTDWSNYNQENDFSFKAEAGYFLENLCYTVYKNDKLVWGREPVSPAVVPVVNLTPDYYLEISLRGGTGGPIQVEVNGELYELYSHTELRDQVVYRKNLPAEILQEINFIRILPQPSPAEITSPLLAVRKKDGEQSFPGGRLNDRLLLTPVPGESEEIISLQDKTLLEKVIVHTQNSFYTPLYAWVDNGWRELTPVELLPGCIIYNGGVLTQKLRMINNGFNSLSEVQVFGSGVTGLCHYSGHDDKIEA